MGRITRDPELRYTQSNIPVVSFTLAVDRNYRSKNEQQDTADFINCVAWRNTAEFVSKWFPKGRMMCVVGTIQTRNYEDKNGERRYVTEVVVDEVSFTGERRDDAPGRFANQPQSGSPFTPEYSGSPSYQDSPAPFDSNISQSDFVEFEDDSDDDLPF